MQYKIGFIGASKAGTNLARLFQQHQAIMVCGFYSLNTNALDETCKLTGLAKYNSMSTLINDCNILFITTRDDQIVNIWQKICSNKNIQLKNKVFVHCSGFLSSAILEYIQDPHTYKYEMPQEPSEKVSNQNDSQHSFNINEYILEQIQDPRTHSCGKRQASSTTQSRRGAWQQTWNTRVWKLNMNECNEEYCRASLHPIYPFTHKNIDIKELSQITFTLEGGVKACNKLQEILLICGNSYSIISPDLKPLYHFACFTLTSGINALFSWLSEVCPELDIYKLLPLSSAAINNLATNKDIAKSITGPIARADIKILEKYVTLLNHEQQKILKFIIVTLVEKIDVADKSKFTDFISSLMVS